MPAICFYFQVHQPYRIKPYRIFDIGKDSDYFNGQTGELDNGAVLKKVAKKCYLPMNEAVYDLLQIHPEFKVSYSLSGVVLEQFEEYAPEVLESFKKLVDTGRVELLAETYYHSLAYLYSQKEFKRQVKLHQEKIEKIFGIKPKIFRNTELAYSNDIAKTIEDMGYEGILMEGADHILGWRSPNFVYKPKGTKKIRALLKDYKLSDDIAFRFSAPWWEEFPLDVDKFERWVSAKNGNGEVINLFMDYETFGEHQWEETGIFDFVRALPKKLLSHPDNSFITPSEAIRYYDPVGEVDVPHYMSWADTERDLSAWRSNPIQYDAFDKVYSLEKEVLKTNDPYIISDWGKLQTSDHFYYMCTKWFADGDVHKYFNPYDTPFDAFINYSNVIQDFKRRIKNNKIKQKQKERIGKKHASKK
tara:strand:+ start:5639 stop:6886 length:1248 start_codon:yes stop_codon:yes gene_type:complete